MAFYDSMLQRIDVCWRVGITRPITKVFVGNLNKTE